MLRKLLNVSIVTVAAAAGLAAQAGDSGKVLADLRAALGGADRLASIQTMTAVGVTRKTMGKSVVESEASVMVELPRKYVSRGLLVPSPRIYRSTGFDGERAINDTEQPSNIRSPVEERISVRTPGMVWPSGLQTPEQKAAADKRVVLAAKREFARMTAGMLASSHVAFPVEFTYEGQQDLPEGKAHVIDIRGADKFEARLFVAGATSLPLMLTWTDLQPWVVWSTSRADVSQEELGFLEMVKARQDASEAALKMVEYRVYYSNFKVVDGLNLPHTLTRWIDGKVSDTTTFTEIRITSKIARPRS
jgi:hypothetical protein